MNKKILNYLIFIIIALILLYFARNNYRDFNINKTISACVLAKMQTNKDNASITAANAYMKLATIND